MGKIKRICEIVSREGTKTLYLKLKGKLKSRTFLKLINKGKWEEAVLVGECLFYIFPDNESYPRKLAECYQNLNKYDRAFKIIQSYRKLNYNLKEVVEISEDWIKTKTSSVKSKYLHLHGNNNDGLIEHTLKDSDQKYLTKIIHSNQKEVEEFFYLRVYKLYPQFKKVTPEFMRITEVKKYNLCLISMEKIDGVQPKLNDKVINHVGKISKLISSVKYGEIVEWFPIIDITHRNNELLNLLWSFSSIHHGWKNKEIFESLYEKMERLGYSTESFSLIRQLEAIILKNNMYNLIEPKKHYAIQHGDYFHWNLLSTQESKEIFVIDWGCMKIGPSWCDMAGFLGTVRHPFHKVQSDFLLNEEVSGHLEPIEKLFFIYTLINVWFTVYSRKEFDKSHAVYLRPAIEQIQQIAMKINNNQLDNVEHM